MRQNIGVLIMTCETCNILVRSQPMRQFKFDLKKAALLVIDMQQYFTDSGSHAYVPGSPKIIREINKLICKFKKNKRPVIFTRHIDVNKKSLMCRWWRDSINKKNPLSRIDERLDSHSSKVIIKHHYDAFYKTGLEKILRKKKISQVVITGVVTHLCCETTARSAFMRDLLPYVVVDACASHRIAHHKASIYNLARGFAVPVKTDKLLSVL